MIPGVRPVGTPVHKQSLKI